MLYPLNTHFNKLFENLRPPEERLRAAQDFPSLVRGYLKDSESFPTLYPHSTLVGAYGQDLCAGDVKDVDFIVRVEGDPDKNEPEARQLVQDLKKALDGLPEALGLTGAAYMDDITVTRARRSVQVHFEERDFYLDVVPCVAPNGFDYPVWVPDRGFNKWIKSHPVGVINLLTELSESLGSSGPKVRKLGKLFKYFRDEHMKTRKPKSYWLLALLLENIQGEVLDMDQPIGQLFHDLLDACYVRFAPILGRTDGATPHIKDPILGHDISWNWERNHFETFMRRLDDGRKWSEKALVATERETAISYWQRVFGDAFPSDVEQAAKENAAKGFPGSSWVAPSGIVASAPAAQSVRMGVTKFHGEEA
jgi:hypothetical protein